MIQYTYSFDYKPWALIQILFVWKPLRWVAALLAHGPLSRDVKLRVAHVSGMPGTISPPPITKKPLVNDPGMHRGTCLMHLPWCMSRSLTRGGEKNVPGIPDACAILGFWHMEGWKQISNAVYIISYAIKKMISYRVFWMVHVVGS